MVFKLWMNLDGGLPADDSRYTYKELRLYVRSAIAIGLKQNFYENLNSDEYRYGADNISVTSKVEVKYEDATGLNYIDAPTETISVAGNRLTSISSPNPFARYAITYVPIRQEELIHVRNQPSIPCVIMFYRDGNKLYFLNGEVKDKEVKLTQKYTIPEDDNTELSIPEDIENGIIDIARRLILNPVIPSDRNNDGVPNT